MKIAAVKLVGALLLAASSCMMGYALGRDLRQRIVLLGELAKGLRLLGQEIAYRKSPLEEALQAVGGALSEPWNLFFCSSGKRLEQLPCAPVDQIWEEQEECQLKGLPFTEADRRLIRQIGRQLGHPEMLRGGEILTLYEIQLEEQLLEAKEECRSKAKLYGKLGIAGGIFMVILLI